MNFFEGELRLMFGNNNIIHNPKIVGKTLLGRLDDDLRVKLQFVSTYVSNHYDAIQVSILNRTDGLVDKETMLFGDIIRIDHDMDVDCDIGQEITCYIETWFDVDKKFGLHTADDDGTWLNMYGKYNPFADTLRIECEISRDKGSECFDYEPTASESQLIKSMIAEKIMEMHGQTPEEFCDGFYGYKPEFGGLR